MNWPYWAIDRKISSGSHVKSIKKYIRICNLDHGAHTVGKK